MLHLVRTVTSGPSSDSSVSSSIRFKFLCITSWSLCSAAAGSSLEDIQSLCVAGDAEGFKEDGIMIVPPSRTTVSSSERPMCVAGGTMGICCFVIAGPSAMKISSVNRGMGEVKKGTKGLQGSV